MSLKDAAGKARRVANERINVTVATRQFQLDPESDTVNANGRAGQINVKAPAGKEEWTAGGWPDWVTFQKEPGYGNESVIRYQVAENDSYKARSAAIAIGDAKFELTQWGSPMFPFHSRRI